MIRILGTMTDPSGAAVPGAIIELRAISSTDEVLLGSVVTHKCDQQGKYDFQLAIGKYDTYAQNDRCGDMDYLGTASVSVTSVDGNLHSILVDGGINITPPMLEAALAAAQRAELAAASATINKEGTSRDAEATKRDAESASSSAQQATQSANTATSAKESIVADTQSVRVLADQVSAQSLAVAEKHGEVLSRSELVSTQAGAVATQHQEVLAKASQVSANTQTVLESTSMAVAAADTATQKAALSASHEAVSLDAATRAEAAASAVVGTILDGGECDLSSGAYPAPITVSGKHYSSIWYVAVAGVVSGISFDVGDMLRYTTAKGGYYFKVDARDEVYSVNGEKGAVIVTPDKIGAERSGVAQQLTEQHSARVGAHSISGVAGLEQALSDKYSPSNKPSAVDIGAFPISGGDLSGTLSSLGALISKGGYVTSIKPVNPMFEWHIPGKHAAIAYLTDAGDLRFATSNGAAGEVNLRCIMKPDGGFLAGSLGANTSKTSFYNEAIVSGEASGIVRGAVGGGGWNEWRVRSAALLVDCPSSTTSAHQIWKATHWGKAHLAGMDVHSPSGDGSIVTVALHVGGTNNAFNFNQGGQAYAVGGWFTGSDARFKRKIKKPGLKEGVSWLDVVRSFRARVFEYKADPGRARLGFIAQHVVKHLPVAVYKSEPQLRDRLFVDDVAIIAAQHEAINEMADTIDELKEQIAMLKRSIKLA